MSLFDNSSGDWIDSRFTEESRQAFLKQFENFDEVKLEKSYPIPLRFKGEFDLQIKKAIQVVASQCFDFAKAAGYEVCHSNPEIEIFGQAAWAKTDGKQPKDLPAATITHDYPAIIQVIVPDQITGSEGVIKTVRLILSKLYGTIFFEEHVPQRAPYLLLQEELTEIEFDILEKIHLVRFLELTSSNLDSAYKATADKLMIRGPQAKEAGKRELYKELLDKPDKPHPQFSAISEAFDSTLGLFQKEPLQFFHKILDPVFSQVALSRFILPHEMANFEAQKSGEIWSVFHALEERLQLAANCIEDLNDCYSYLKDTRPELLNPEMLQSLGTTLSQRMKQLTTKKLVKLFLFEEATLSKKQQHKLAQFPLFLWKNKLVKVGPAPEKQVESLLKQYRGAIFQKVFEQCYRMKKAIKECLNNPTKFQLTDTRIKTLVALIGIRQAGILDMLHSVRVGKALQGVAKIEKVDKSNSLNRFEEAWNYFISFALLHQYYLAVDKKKKTNKAKDFTTLIKNYLEKGLELEDSYPIAMLLVKLYEQNNFNLLAMRDLIESPSQTLDFFILNQQKLVEARDINELIESFTIKLKNWQVARYQQKVTPDEIKSIHKSTV
ncbi:MAG: hypothetical protein QNL04_05270 [SAR324 cluster bacterium]|nr:hypothetical protein [SAR324 cluster bacterium]